MLFVLGLPVAFAQDKGHLLDLSPRRQWDSHGGFCGACSIQQAALHFGAYASQDALRKAIGDREILLGANEHRVLEALGLDYERWDSRTQAEPQGKTCLVWVKKHLQRGAPVLLGVYTRGQDDPDYDHIVCAVGYHAPDAAEWRAGDILVYNDNYSQQPRYRSFASLLDKRAMRGGSRGFRYALPSETAFGCAVMGVRDEEGVTVPVRLSVDHWGEPNVREDQEPISLTLHVTVRSTKPGNRYVLYRYNHLGAIPAKDFEHSKPDERIQFISARETWTHTTRVPSDQVAVFRCAPL